MKKHKYKVGDRLTIVKNISGHCFKIGATVIILEVFIDNGVVHYKAGWGENKWFVEDEELNDKRS